MMADLYQLALYAYAATILAALIAEFCPLRRIALPAAVVSIVLSIVAGGSWCYTVNKQGYVFENSQFPARAAKRAPRERTDQAGGGQGGGKTVAGQSSGSGEPDLEEEASSGDGGGGFVGSVGAVNRSLQSGADALLDQLIPGRRTNGKTNASRDFEGDIVRDCPTCPEMVIVAGGTQLIGASESNPVAAEAERPQRQIRFWPGFAISRNPISAADVAAFRLEAGTGSPVCAGPAGLPATSAATCLLPSEADRYAAWLTARTGKRFRIPTAVEWEYAARTAGVTVLANNGLAITGLANTGLAKNGAGTIAAPLDGIGRDAAELTSDCWMPYIPSAGNERRNWNSNALLCHELVLKGARPGELDVHKRFSARRPIPIERPDWGTGFRVVRDAK